MLVQLALTGKDRRQSAEVRTMPALLVCKVFLIIKEARYQLDYFNLFYPFSYFIITVIQINLKCDIKFEFNG